MPMLTRLSARAELAASAAALRTRAMAMRFMVVGSFLGVAHETKRDRPIFISLACGVSASGPSLRKDDHGVRLVAHAIHDHGRAAGRRHVEQDGAALHPLDLQARSAFFI